MPLMPNRMKKLSPLMLLLGAFVLLALIYAWAGLFSVTLFVFLPLNFRPWQLFPEDAVPAGARLPKWPWLFAIAGLLWIGVMFGAPPALVRTVGLVVDLAYCITFLGYLSYKFVHADPVTRRQFKWVLYGFYVAVVPYIGVEVLVVVFKPTLWPMFELVLLFSIFVPLSAFIAIVRFNLFDIDRLIGATAAYTLHRCDRSRDSSATACSASR